MTQNRRTGKSDGAAPLGNQETVLRVSLGAGLVAVLVAQSFLDVAHCFNALGVRLPLPEHDKSLTADAAVGFSVSVGAFAENLHLSTSLIMAEVSQPRR
jgi:hypothetical protein